MARAPRFCGTKGYKKYRCDECGEESRHHWVERNRAARLRCPGCGSARMELVTQEAKEEAAALQAVRIEGHRDMTLPPKTLDAHKKVT